MQWPEFVRRFFRCLGAKTEPLSDGLRVELTHEQLRLVEGRPSSLFGWDWNPGVPQDEVTTWQLAFGSHPTAGRSSTAGPDPLPQSKNPVSTELCVPQSYRGRQLIDAALRLWPLGRLYLRPALRSGRWRPWLVFHLLLTYVADDAHQRLQTAAIDLVSGEAIAAEDMWPGASSMLIDEKNSNDFVVEDPGDFTAEAPLLSIGDAHARAIAYIQGLLASEDDAWAAAQRVWIQDEFDQLQTYLRRAELEESSDTLGELRSARLAELRQLQPRVDVEIAAATVVYVLTPG